MSGGFIQFTETDFGSKGRAKRATEEFPKGITREGKWRLEAWWFQVLQTARALCPVDTGTLMSTIRIEMKGTSETGSYEISFVPKSDMLNSEIVAGGMLINPKTGRMCDYAQAVHDGHFTRSGKWVPEQPFLRMAVNLHIHELDKILLECVDKNVRTIWVGE